LRASWTGGQECPSSLSAKFFDGRGAA